MKARELLQAGRLSAAVAALSEEVKLHPADVQLRTFLFELLCFAGRPAGFAPEIGLRTATRSIVGGNPIR